MDKKNIARKKTDRNIHSAKKRKSYNELSYFMDNDYKFYFDCLFSNLNKIEKSLLIDRIKIDNSDVYIFKNKKIKYNLKNCNRIFNIENDMYIIKDSILDIFKMIFKNKTLKIIDF